MDDKQRDKQEEVILEKLATWWEQDKKIKQLQTELAEAKKEIEDIHSNLQFWRQAAEDAVKEIKLLREAIRDSIKYRGRSIAEICASHELGMKWLKECPDDEDVAYPVLFSDWLLEQALKEQER